MDRETLVNFIKNLGKAKFDAVCLLLLTRIFHLKLIDVDDRRDGGADYRVLLDSGGSTTAAYQKTTQEARWHAKAMDDARHAVASLGATRFFFVTSRARDNIDLVALENEITSELRIPATCMGAREIANVLVSHKLVPHFLSAINAPVNVRLDERPDRSEILLHAYVALGADTATLREEVYDDTVRLCLYVRGTSLSRRQLVEQAITELGCSRARWDLLNRRVDSLLARGLLLSLPDGRIALSEDGVTEIASAERIYLQELEDLAASQAQLLREECGVSWAEEEARLGAVILARHFIRQQLNAARHAKVEFTSLDLVQNIGDPDQEPRDLLVRVGVPTRKVTDILAEFVENARETPLIKKLARAATYVAIEGKGPLSSAKAIGAASWSEVTLILDASVAIPYICAKLFSPTSGRFSLGALESVTTFVDLGARAVIPDFYVNECASHLLRALDYGTNVTAFEDDLAYSRNGYVAQYYRLKKAGKHVPDTIRGFLAQFARSVASAIPDVPAWRRKVMSELQPQFRRYGVQWEGVAKVPNHFRKEVETEYVYSLKNLRRWKYAVLIDHDVLALSHMRRCIAERGESRMCLTWDGAMIDVGRRVEGCGWVVSPQEAVDFAQPYLPLSSGKMCAIAHALASVRERPMDVAGRILDRVVSSASERLQDWEFQEKIRGLKKDILDRIDVADIRYADWIDKETEKFLEAEGVDVRAETRETEEQLAIDW